MIAHNVMCSKGGVSFLVTGFLPSGSYDHGIHCMGAV